MTASHRGLYLTGHVHLTLGRFEIFAEDRNRSGCCLRAINLPMRSVVFDVFVKRMGPDRHNRLTKNAR